MVSYPTWKVLLDSTRVSRDDRTYNKAMNNLAAKYKLFCRNNHFISYPASAASISAYICFHVVKNNGSAKSIGSVISLIKRYGILKGFIWLNLTETSKLDEVRKELLFRDSNPIDMKKPFTLELIIRIINILNLNNDEELLFALCMLLCHNGLFRSAELFSGLQVKRFIWNHRDKSVTIQLDRSKRNQAGGPQFILISDYNGLSSYKLLVEWFDRHNLWLQPESYVIPRIISISNNNYRKETFKPRRIKLDFSMSGSIYWWRRWIGKGCTMIGLDPQYYSGHSFRAGGATDLFTARVPFHIIKKMGRWKSDSSCMRYYRDDIDIAEAVAVAFGNACSNEVININNRNSRMGV
jgi:hypothetical protein